MDAEPEPPEASAAEVAEQQQNRRLTANEFEMMRQFGPRRCTFKLGEKLIVNGPDYAALPNGALVVVEALDHGPPATYTIRFTGEMDKTQQALSGAATGTKDEVRAGVLEKYLRNPNVLTTARNCAGNMGLAQLLNTARQYTVPLFQRKYCWRVAQWQQLWKDIRALAANPSHHMGKLAIYEEPNALVLPTARAEAEAAEADAEYRQFSAFSSARNGMARAVRASQLMVIDGQQRLTTCAIILAALRDVAAELAGRAGGAEALAAAETMSATVDGLLFHEDQWFAAYRAAVGREGRPPAAGDERASQLLEWLRENLSFLPTHDDRAVSRHDIADIWVAFFSRCQRYRC